ncbi:hypothetical protein SAMN02799630_05869 [Paenibacillus sp. UNCCL117]|nr:hypothetical protein [Paenibacillus sp. cl123]SDB99723.1 hypothetical protein SAMN04488602_10146 [Paenibacillus sp. cl123]SFW69184.1 hypothetical protein SAMN02799630_05869 [Paenibacillus sp. UNCCL117]
MLPMEQETMELLVIGYAIVMGIAVVFVSLLWIKERKEVYASAFGWMLAHFLVFTAAVACCLTAIGSRHEQQAMASEANSLWLGAGGVLWAAAMLCLLAAVSAFTARKMDSPN